MGRPSHICDCHSCTVKCSYAGWFLLSIELECNICVVDLTFDSLGLRSGHWRLTCLIFCSAVAGGIRIAVSCAVYW